MSSNFIPLADPAGDAAPLRESILAAVGRVFDRGSYILGSEVVSFEQRMAAQLGVSGAIGVASGTDALAVALLALGIGPGHEVITVSFTAGPTVAAIQMVGATPVLIDVERDTFCLDPGKLGAAAGPQTRGIIVVHLYGHPASLDAICAFARQRGIAVIEDCAQAQEAMIGERRVGAIGDISCFSFYPTKNLGALGDGGLIAAKDANLVERARQLRTYGWTRPQFSEIPFGRASRLDEVQAAILNVKLDRLEHDVERRRAIAQRYNAAFADLPIARPMERAGFRHVRHLYVIRTKERDRLEKHLKASGVGSGRHYPFAVHEQPGLVAGARIPQPLTVTDEIIPEIVSLPLFPSISDGQQARVIDAVRSFFGRS